ncbi:MAG: hypothetical protein WD355_05545 [Balneolaceae bacterium]
MMNGFPMPVLILPGETVLHPEMLFGHLVETQWDALFDIYNRDRFRMYPLSIQIRESIYLVLESFKQVDLVTMKLNCSLIRKLSRAAAGSPKTRQIVAVLIEMMNLNGSVIEGHDTIIREDFDLIDRADYR